MTRGDCSQSSSFLEIYEKQLRGYLNAFNIPENYQKRILAEQKKLQEAYNIDEQRTALEAQLKRLEELYKWGHKTRAEYLADYNAIKRQTQQFTPTNVDILQKLASFLKYIKYIT